MTTHSTEKGSSVEDFDESKLGQTPSEVLPVDDLKNSTLDELYIDPVREARLVRKLDMRIAPVMCGVFLLAYLDRSNISNAATAGLVEDAGLVGRQLNIGITLFYVLYVLAEGPGTLLMKYFRPSRFITFLMVAWGLVTIFSGFVDSFASLCTTRLLLGMLESPLFPSLTLYLSGWYRREEQGRRVAYLFVASALSGAFGGLIAYGILRMDGIGGRAGWQWLYIIEGLITVLFGLTIYFLLPDSPEVAWYLTAEDKELMAIRYRANAIYNGKQDFDWKQVKASLTDYKLYLNGFAQFSMNTASFGYSNFLPTIIKGFGYNTLLTQLITAPIYFWAAAFYLTIAYFSDRTNKRSAFLIPCSCIVISGYAILVSDTTSVPARLLGCVLAATGIWACVGLNITLISSAQAPYYKRASSIGFQQAIGNCAGLLSSNIFIKKDGPRYKMGVSITIAFACLAFTLYSIQAWNFRRLNRIREALTPEERQRWLDEGREGDDHPDFRYPQ